MTTPMNAATTTLRDLLEDAQPVFAQDRVWLTRDRTEVLIADMTDSHRTAVLALLVRQARVRAARPKVALYLDVVAFADVPPNSDFSAPSEVDLLPDVEAAVAATALGQALSPAAG